MHQTPRQSLHEPMGWWVIAGSDLLQLLHRAHQGEDPDLIYTEAYANSNHHGPDDD